MWWLVGLALALTLTTGCTATYASHGRVMAYMVGAADIEVCQRTPDPDAAPVPAGVLLLPAAPAKENCIRIEGAPLSSHAANALSSVGGIIWEIIKFIVPVVL